LDRLLHCYTRKLAQPIKPALHLWSHYKKWLTLI
jgi:hypothetical protein